ncbi:membrane protein [Desulfocarbo indianensis]|nr:membrane protein [Desulfocarbo indianensis]
MVLLYFVSFLALFTWSAVNPHDRFTWVLEVAPAIMGLLALALTYRRFRLTTLVYTLIWLHMAILVVGGHYTYAEVPAGRWVSDLLGMERNNYDKLGHFAQGFVPAVLSREILARLRVINGRGWLFFLVCCVCLAFSAVYELIEWAAAVMTGEAAEAFLGTQGYAWDTQSDMGLALIGAVLAQAFLNRLHDRQLARISS